MTVVSKVYTSIVAYSEFFLTYYRYTIRISFNQLLKYEIITIILPLCVQNSYYCRIKRNNLLNMYSCIINNFRS